MSRYLRPDSDVDAGSWTTAPLHPKVNTVTRDDTTLVESSDADPSECTLGLSAVPPPDTGLGTLRWTRAKTADLALADDPVLRVQLRASGALVAEWTETLTSETLALRAEAVDVSAVTDWAALSVRFVREGAGAVRQPVRVSWVELEVPDPPPPPGPTATYPAVYQVTYGAADAAPAVTASVHAPDGTHLADLPRLAGWRWSDELAGPGGGEVSVPADDGRAGVAGDGDVVVLRLGGLPVAGFRVEPPSRRDLVAEGPRTVTLAGRGVLALLADAAVYPERGAGRLEPQTRPLNWAARDWVEWAHGPNWGAPSLHGRADAPDNPTWDGFPEGWPSAASHAEWMWAGPSLAGAPAYVYDPFDAYFRRTLTLAADEDVIVAATADDEVRVLIDGQEVVSSQGPLQWRRTFVWRGRLAAGVHQMAVWGRNLARNTGEWAPASGAGVLLAVGRHDDAGEMTQVFGVSDGDWLAVGDVDPPGMTPGRAIGVLLAEAQGRGCLPGMVKAFDDEASTPRPGNSLGEQWLQDEDRVVDCGRSLLDVVSSAQVDVAVHLEPSGRDVVPTLRMWGRGRRSRDLTVGNAPVVLRPGRDVVSMTAERPGVRSTVLLVDTPDGWTEAVHADAAVDRREAHLRLGEHEQPSSAAQAVDVELVERADPTPVATVVLADTARARPHSVFGVGDVVLAPSFDDPGVLASWQVLTVACQGSGDDPQARWTVELGPPT